MDHSGYNIETLEVNTMRNILLVGLLTVAALSFASSAWTRSEASPTNNTAVLTSECVLRNHPARNEGAITQGIANGMMFACKTDSDCGAKKTCCVDKDGKHYCASACKAD